MRRTLASMVLTAAVLLGACSADNDDSAGDSGSSRQAEEASASGGSGGEPSFLAAGQALQSARQLVRTAELTMTVDDVAATAREAATVAQQAGGYQSGGTLDLEAGDPTGTITLRVPADQFEAVLDALRAMGELSDQRIETADATEQVVDLESRLVTARASLERLRGFLAEAMTIAEIVTLEGELVGRESQVEQLEGQLRVISEQVALSTITVRLGETAAPPLGRDPSPSDDIPGFVDGLRHGWVALVNTVGVVLTGVGAALPFLLVAGPVGYVSLWWRRRNQASVGGVEP